MITDNLFDKVLIQPMQNGADELLVISGYATANMAYRHLKEMQEARVTLVYGMAQKDGVLLTDHKSFKQLEQLEKHNDRFKCHYRVKLPAVHSKVYVWLADGKPIKAFVGSANYTQAGFGLGRNHGEVMVESSPQAAFNYFERIRRGAMEIDHEDIETHVSFHDRGQQPGENSDDFRTVRLYGRNGQVQTSAGLNWGFRQRPGYCRNLDEAYIQIGRSLGQEDFFPPKPTRFTIITDDDHNFIAVRAQKSQAGDAIETPEDNAFLGKYFRNRLGIESGTFITKDMLEQYGRDDVTFFKIDEETFIMDFSV